MGPTQILGIQAVSLGKEVLALLRRRAAPETEEGRQNGRIMTFLKQRFIHGTAQAQGR